MRADKRTTIALYTFCGIPFGNADGNAAFFILCRSDRERAIRVGKKFTDRYIVAFLGITRDDDFFDEIGKIILRLRNIGRKISPCCRYRNFMDIRNTTVNSGLVHGDDFFPFGTISLLDSFFHIADCIIYRKDIG